MNFSVLEHTDYDKRMTLPAFALYWLAWTTFEHLR